MIIVIDSCESLRESNFYSRDVSRHLHIYALVIITLYELDSNCFGMFAGIGLTTSSGGNGVTGDSAKSSSNDPFAFKDTTPKTMPNPFSSKSGSSNSGNSSKDSSFNSSSSSLNNSGTTATAAATGRCHHRTQNESRRFCSAAAKWPTFFFQHHPR